MIMFLETCGITINKHNECILLEHVILQFFCFFSFPTQGSPPFSGFGLSHFRVRICFPLVVGHLALQFVHEDHVPQPPLTEKYFKFLKTIQYEQKSKYQFSNDYLKY